MSELPAEILGQYEIEETLEGGQTTVFKALHRERGRTVAIRVANELTKADPTRLARFVEGMRGLARIQDEGVLYVHEFRELGPEGADSYLISEWLDRPLDEWMTREQADVPVALRILEKITRGLGAIHAEGILHRDLQPRNVLVSDDTEFVRISDLGGLEGTLGESPMYTAPEVYDEAAVVDGRADLYSLGVLAYELLLGPERFREQFPEIYGAGEDESRRVRWVNWHRDPERIAPALALVKPEIPETVSDLVVRLLSKDPAGRPEDAGEVLRILGTLDGRGAAQAPIPILTATGSDDGARRILGMPMWLAGSAAAALALVVAGTLFLAFRGPSARDLAHEAGRAMKVARDRAMEAGAPERPDIVEWPRGEETRAAGLTDYEAREWEDARARFVAATDLYFEAERLALIPLPESPPVEPSGTESGEDPTGVAGAAGVPPVYRVGSTTEEIDAAMTLCAQYQARCDRSIYESEILREVALQPFELDAMEITNRQFGDFVSATGYATDSERRGYAFVFGGFGSVKQPGATWRSPSGPGDVMPASDHPVVNVSANDAAAYCRWTGGRLPTAEEWEFTARGIERRIFPWGEQWADGPAVWGEGVGVRPVGSIPKGATPAGHLDLAGNVWEWTASVRDGKHVLKGGSHLEPNPTHLRPAFERLDAADAAHPDDGFRCAHDR